MINCAWNGSEIKQYYILSQNLNRRIEVAFPLYDEKHIAEIKYNYSVTTRR